jgi:hypothetical protein
VHLPGNHKLLPIHHPTNDGRSSAGTDETVDCLTVASTSEDDDMLYFSNDIEAGESFIHERSQQRQLRQDPIDAKQFRSEHIAAWYVVTRYSGRPFYHQKEATEFVRESH